MSRSELPSPACAYCEGEAVSALDHGGLRFCSLGCLWDAAFCNGFDAALNKIQGGASIASLEIDTIDTTPRDPKC